MSLYKDVEGIILDYIEDLKIHDKRLKVFEQIKDIDRYEISLCQHCRDVKIRTEIINTIDSCNHYFFLTKPLFISSSRNYANNRVLKHNPFYFYCIPCQKYDFFFHHFSMFLSR